MAFFARQFYLTTELIGGSRVIKITFAIWEQLRENVKNRSWWVLHRDFLTLLYLLRENVLFADNLWSGKEIYKVVDITRALRTNDHFKTFNLT